MTEPEPTAFDPDIAQLVEYHVARYLLAVARHLLRDGVPVGSMETAGPYDPGEIANPDFGSAIGWIRFTADFSRLLSGAGTEATLDWSEASGWSMRREALRGGEDIRWLGAGLVPEPRQVVRFVDSARMDFETCGSVDRPHYRSITQDRRDLLTRLAAYLGGVRGLAADAREEFEIDKKITFLRQAMDELLTEDEDPVLSVPLRRSEARALAVVLDYAEYGYASDVIAAMRADLAARLEGDPGDCRTAADRARRQREARPWATGR